MDFNWRFSLGDHPGAEFPEFNDNDWRKLNVPHDWGIESEFSKNIPHGSLTGYLPLGTGSIGWYRKNFTLSKRDLNNSIWIEFDGVYMNSDVWINGKHLGHYPNGYNSFHYELSKYVKAGQNMIVVRVDNSLQPNTRWYAGAGIYRHVRLLITSKLHISHYGINITTPVITEELGVISVRTTIENDYSNKREGTLLSVITDIKGKEVSKFETPFSVDSCQKTEIFQRIQVQKPTLWSPEKPKLYVLKSFIMGKGKIIDNNETRFGIRKIEFLADKGFLLNGIQTKIKGVCIHHTIGCVGSAVPEAVWIRYLNKLKEMGCNAIRTAHNPFAPEFLAMCDSIGFLVMEEAFDELKEPKANGMMTNNVVPYGYHIYFDKWGIYDLIQEIRRDRNHPSVIIWGVANEVKEQVTPDGYKTIKKLITICHSEDPTRPATSTCNRIARDYGPSTTLEFMESLDIVGYNYVGFTSKRRELLFSIDKFAHPEWKILATENSSIYSVRGKYSLGNDPNHVNPSYNTNMIDQEQLWKSIMIHDYLMGIFLWTGIDYLGESHWPNIGPPCGEIDRCGFPKDAFYFYQSIWTKKPMIHIFPHWNWKGREGQVIPVICYTNCDAVELFLNDKSFGEKRLQFPRLGSPVVGSSTTYDSKEHVTTSDLHLSWDIPYKPGILRAVGKKQGKVVYTTEIRTVGEPAAIRLSADKNQLKSDNRDVVQIKVEIVDKDGFVVPEAGNMVEFTIEGPGKLIGVDNGNPQDHNSFKLNRRNVFHGLCLAVIQSNGKPGKIKITARSEKLDKKILVIESKPNI